MKDNSVYTICYNTLDVFENKKKAKDHYSFCYYSSEGAEQSRYANILVDLNFSNTGRDKVSTDCYEIFIDKIKTNIKLDKHYSIDDTIKYYEENIKPILDVSEEFDIDFKNETPFEYFSDEYNVNLYTFSDYYAQLAIRLGINACCFTTKEKSDGKYEMDIDGEIIDIRAWDKFEDVLENVKIIKELFKDKEKGDDYER